MDLEVGENLNLSSRLSISKFGLFSNDSLGRESEMILNLDIRTPNADMIVRYLWWQSAKVVIGRCH